MTAGPRPQQCTVTESFQVQSTVRTLINLLPQLAFLWKTAIGENLMQMIENTQKLSDHSNRS